MHCLCVFFDVVVVWDDHVARVYGACLGKLFMGNQLIIADIPYKENL